MVAIGVHVVIMSIKRGGGRGSLTALDKTPAHILLEWCTDGDIRLVGGEDSGEGRLEYFFSGVWGTVCNDEWDLNDTIVACRQLGYNVTSESKQLSQ